MFISVRPSTSIVCLIVGVAIAMVASSVPAVAGGCGATCFMGGMMAGRMLSERQQREQEQMQMQQQQTQAMQEMAAQGGQGGYPGYGGGGYRPPPPAYGYGPPPPPTYGYGPPPPAYGYGYRRW